MPGEYSLSDVLERMYQNQLALEAALMELTLQVEADGHAEVGDNVRGALYTIGENAGHIKQGLARLKKTPMTQPLFDFDLKRVSRTHYITGKAAINFPHAGITTGGWHFLSYFDRDSGVAKVSLAGIHYPDTTEYFGEAGVIDVTDKLAKQGWSEDGKRLFMADHCRAAADMIVRWALSDSEHCNVKIGEWFPARDDKQRLLRLLALAKPKLTDAGRLQKIEAWLSSQ